ncbi:SDR family oxidoreductase [Rhodanobacter ginsengisoli]|uniref:SDR family oxidoreductase n=1 Tax=Rhodanobacter ginsengisoli TaxID=418646 RepID=A0ABW0QGU2_9GAMM
MLLVTGATGLNGQLAVREFARNGSPARALVRDCAKARAAGLDRLAGIELVEADMRRAATLGAALAGVERVLMISGAAPDMAETQCTFIDACKAAGVRHIIKFSGSEPGSDPTRFRFTRMHEEIEDYLEGSGLAWTHLRPSQFMQVYLREAHDIATTGTLRLPFEDIALSPVDAADIARVAYLLLRDGGHEGESLEMTGPEALTMDDIAGHISTAIGTTVAYVRITPDERRRELLARGLPAYFVDALDEQTEERLKNPVAKVLAATHRMFGVRPTSFIEFLQRHAAAFSGKPT